MSQNIKFRIAQSGKIVKVAKKDKKDKKKDEDPCWEGYKMIGHKKGKGGKEVPNCVPKDDDKKDSKRKSKKKKASKDDEADSSGQLDVEPLHQDSGDSESTHPTDVNEHSKKNKKSKGDDEADSSGQLEVEPLHQEKSKEAQYSKQIKVSNLDNKTKQALAFYYTQSNYPLEYTASVLNLRNKEYQKLQRMLDKTGD